MEFRPDVRQGFIQVVTGATPKTKVPEFYAPHEADFIAPADLGNPQGVYQSEKKISPAGLATIRPLPAKAVILKTAVQPRMDTDGHG